jgi:GDP-D-mannose 3',5'-epimerase
MRKALVLGAGGFIGSHLVKSLKNDGFWIKGVDLKFPDFSVTHADSFEIGDLRNQIFCESVFDQSYDEVYQLAADMGGAGFIFTGENDADILHNSALINLNIVHPFIKSRSKNLFYSSSACIYPDFNQNDPTNPNCEESSAYPANPDSDYGWEKLFSERLFLAFLKNYDINVSIARYHNIFGPEGTWDGGREKAPAAICRKISKIQDGDEIEIWGDGKQTRSFLYIDDCIEATKLLMRSTFEGPVNIGSDYMISISDLVDLVASIANKKITKKFIDGPEGVRGRVSDNRLIEKKINWKPKISLEYGLELTYSWINNQVLLKK